jgi:hypothetical protein
MKVTKTFTMLVCGLCVGGLGLALIGSLGGSDFLRSLGGFPLFLALFLLPHVLLEWEGSPT